MKRHQPTINVWWLVGILILLTSDWDGTPWLLQALVGLTMGGFALGFVNSIQRAIDHRKEAE